MAGETGTKPDRKADRHKRPPRSVRMPGGLLAWYEQQAGATGQTVNAALVGALEAFRDAHGGGEAVGTATSQAPAPPT